MSHLSKALMSGDPTCLGCETFYSFYFVGSHSAAGHCATLQLCDLLEEGDWRAVEECQERSTRDCSASRSLTKGTKRGRKRGQRTSCHLHSSRLIKLLTPSFELFLSPLILDDLQIIFSSSGRLLFECSSQAVEFKIKDLDRFTNLLRWEPAR